MIYSLFSLWLLGQLIHGPMQRDSPSPSPLQVTPVWKMLVCDPRKCSRIGTNAWLSVPGALVLSMSKSSRAFTELAELAHVARPWCTRHLSFQQRLCSLPISEVLASFLLERAVLLSGCTDVQGGPEIYSLLDNIYLPSSK